MSKNKDFKPKDLVTLTFKKGIYEVISIKQRWESKRGNACEFEDNEYSGKRINDLIVLKQVYSKNSKQDVESCIFMSDSSFCVKLCNVLTERIEDLERQISVYKTLFPDSI